MEVEITMTKIEIQKALYKQKPRATFNYIRNGEAYYSTAIYPGGVMSVGAGEIVNFIIPVQDMGTADFLATMDAKLLGRWIVI